MNATPLLLRLTRPITQLAVVALGLTALFSNTNEEKPQIPSKDSGSPFEDYAKSIECKAHQMGLGLQGTKQDFTCSRFFISALQTSATPDSPSSQPPSGKNQSATKPPENKIYDEWDPRNFPTRINDALQRINSPEADVSYEGYMSMEAYFVAKDSDPVLTRMATEIFGTEESFYKQFDGAVARWAQPHINAINQQLGQYASGTLDRTQKCYLETHLNIFRNLLKERIRFREFFDLKDGLKETLESQEKWAHDTLDKIAPKKDLRCLTASIEPF